MFLEETISCEYVFEWKTVYACQTGKPVPSTTTKCDAIGPDMRQYDLSPLLKTDGNWKVRHAMLHEAATLPAAGGLATEGRLLVHV